MQELYFYEAVSLTAMSLVDSPIRELDVGLSEKQHRTIEKRMFKKLHEAFKQINVHKEFSKEITGHNYFGSNWDIYDANLALEKLKELNIVDKKAVINSIDSEKKAFFQKVALLMVHYSYRNGIVEDYHADKKTNLSDSYMCIINKHIMNMTGLMLELMMNNEDDFLVDIIIHYSKYDKRFLDNSKRNVI